MASLPRVTEYIKNVGKSASYIAKSELEDLAPNITGAVKKSNEIFKVTRNKAKEIYSNYKNGYKIVDFESSDSPVPGLIKKAKNNVLRDIKTGIFYDPKREEDALMESFGFDDLSFDLDFDIDDSDAESSNESSNISNTEKMLAEATMKSVAKSSAGISSYISKTIGDSSKAQAAVTAKSASYISEAVVGMSKLQLAKMDSILNVSKMGFNTIHEDITRTNHGIQALAKGQEYAVKYYNDSMQIFRENNALLKELTEMQRNLYKSASDRRYSNIKESGFDKVLGYGGFDLGEFKNNILENIKSTTGFDLKGIKNSTKSGGMLNTILSGAAANPLKLVLQGALSLFTPKAGKKAVESLDQTFGSIANIFMKKLMEATQSTDFFKSTIAKILLPAIDKKDKVNTGRYNKEAIPFDGITKQAIVETIPGYLRRIEAALTGKEERFYDLNNGKWVNKSEAIKSFKKEEERNKAMSMWDLNSAINSYMNSDKSKSKYSKLDKKEIERQVHMFMDQIYKNNGVIDSKKQDKYGMDPEVFTAVMDAINNTDKGRSARKKLTIDVLRSKQQYSRVLQNIEDDPSNLYRIMFNGDVSSTGSKPNDKDKKKNVLERLTDAYNNNIFFYLKGIYDAVTEGKPKKPTSTVSGTPGLKEPAITTHKDRVKQAKESKTDSDSDDEDYLGSVFEDMQKEKDKEEKFKKDAKNAAKDASKKGILKRIKDAIKNGKSFGKTLKNILEIPGDVITGMVQKADRNLYKFLFGDDYESLDEETKLNGLFGTMVSKMDKMFEEASKKFKSFFDETFRPFTDWLYDKFDTARNTVGELLSPVFDKAKEKLRYARDTVVGDVKDIFASVFNRGRRNDTGQNAFGGRVVKGGLTVVSPGETIIPAPGSYIERLNQYNQEGDFLDSLYGGKRKRRNKKKNKATQVAEEVREVEEDPLMVEFKSYNPTQKELETVEKRIAENPEDKEKILKGAIRSKQRQNKRNKNKQNGAAYADAIRGGISDAFVRISNTLSGDKKEKKTAASIIGNTIKDIFKEKGGPSDVLASGLIGGGVSTLFGLVGGPLAGFAVGAGINIVRKSETIQKLLFGNEEHEGGVVPKKFLDFAEKIGINVRKGAVAGALSAFVGPWGLVGGAALGAGAGILSSTNKFKDVVFGKEGKDGKREGGLVGYIKEYAVKPMKVGVEKIIDGVKGFFYENVVEPLHQFVQPATQAIKNIGHSIKRKFMDSVFVKAVTKPIQATFDRINGAVNKAIKTVVFGPAKLLGKIVTLPFRGLGAIGNRIRASQIKRGTANDMSAEETLQFVQEHPELFNGKLGFAKNTANKALSLIQRKTGLLKNVTGFTGNKNYTGIKNDMQIAGYSDEELQNVIDKLSVVNDFSDKRASTAGQDFYNDLKSSGLINKIGYRTYNKLHKAMATGDPSKVEKILNDQTLFTGKRKLSKKDSDTLRSMLLTRTNEVGRINDLQSTENEALNAGIATIGEFFPNVTNRSQLDNLIRRLKGEQEVRKRKGKGVQGSDLFKDGEGNETALSKASSQAEEAIHKNTNILIDRTEDIIAILKAMLDHDPNSGKSLKLTDSTVSDGIRTHHEARESIRIKQRSKAVEMLNDRTDKDSVTNEKFGVKFSNKFGNPAGIDFASIDRSRISDVNSLKGSYSNQAARELLDTSTIDEKSFKKIKALDGNLNFKISPDDIKVLIGLPKEKINAIIIVHKVGKFKFKNIDDINTITDAISTEPIARVVIKRIKNAGVTPKTAEEFIKFASSTGAATFDPKNTSVSKNLGMKISKVVASIKADEDTEKFIDKSKEHFANSPFASVLGSETEQTSGSRRRRFGISGGSGSTTQISEHGHVITYDENGKPADDTETRKGLEDNRQSEIEDKENSLNIKSMLGETKNIFTHLFGEVKDKAKKAPGILSKIGEKVSFVEKGLKKFLLFLGIVGAGVVAHKSGLLQQLGDFLKEKVWPPLKTFVTEKIWPPVKTFVTDTVFPWIIETAIPTLETGIIEALPGAIIEGVKAALGTADAVAGAGNTTIGSSISTTSYKTEDGKTISGNSTASDSKTIEKKSSGIISELFGKRATNEINYLTDENGNMIKGYIDEEGNIIQDENGSYIPVNNKYKKNNVTDTFGSKILKGSQSSFVQGLMGHTAKSSIFGNIGKAISGISEHFGVLEALGSKAEAVGVAADKVVTGANKFGQSLRNGDTLDKIKNFITGKLGGAAVENADDMVAGSGADFVAAAMENMDDVGGAAMKAAETAEKSGILSGIRTKLLSVMNTLMQNNQVAGFFAKVAKFCGTKLSDTAVGTALTTFAEKMVEKFGQNAATNALSSAASAAASLPLVDIVFACAYFGTGFYNAASILGITEGDITLPYKLLGGFLNVFKVIPVVGIIISVIGVDTLVNLFCDVILKGLFKIEDTDLQKKRENASKELDKWNAEHPEETYDNLKDYNNKDKLLTKAGNVLKKTGKAITDTVFGKNKDYKTSYAYNGVTTNVNIPDVYSNKAANTSSKLGVEGGARSLIPQSNLMAKDNNFSVMGTWSRLSSGISEMIKAAQSGDLSTIQNTISQSIDNTPAGRMVGIMLNAVSPILSMSSLFYNLLNKLSKGMSSFVRGMGNLSNEVNKNVKNSFNKVNNGNDVYSKNVWNIPNYKSRLQGLAGVIAPIVDLTQRMTISPIYSSMGMISNVAGIAGSIGKMLGQPVNTTSVGFSSAPRYNTTTGTMTLSSGGGFLQGVKNFFGGIGKFFTGGKRLGVSGGSGHVYQESSGLKNVPYGNSTLGELGCGPVAATNVLNSLGYGGNVSDAASYAESNGFTNSGGTDMGFIPSYLGSKGIDTYTTANAGEAEAALRNGNQVMLLGQDGGKRYRSGRKAFGSSSHFITAKGIDGAGRVKVEDPDLPGGSNYYGVDEVLDNTKMATIVGKKRNIFGAGRKFLSKFGLFGGAKTEGYSPDAVIAVAKNEVGYLEKRSNSKLEDKTANAGSANYTKYGKWIGANGNYWCASFVSWCFYKAYGKEAGKKILGTYSAACETIRGKIKSTRNPKPGDIIFFKGSRHAGANHIGIIWKVTKDKVYTIEGNTSTGKGVVDNGGGVAKKEYARSNSKILSYGHPKYTAEGSSNPQDTTSDDTTNTGDETTTTTPDITTNNGNSSSGYSLTLPGNTTVTTTNTPNIFESLKNSAKKIMRSVYGSDVYGAITGELDSEDTSGGKRTNLFGRARAQYGPDGMAYGGSPHYITAVGMDDNDVYVEDPDLPGETYKYPKEEVFNNMAAASVVGGKRNNFRNIRKKYGISGGAGAFGEDYMTAAKYWVDKVYKRVYDCKCVHGDSAKKYEDIPKKKHITCTGSASIVFQQAGMIPKGKIVSHTKTKTGYKFSKARSISWCKSHYGSSLKTSMKKALVRPELLIKGTCDIVRVFRKFKNMPSWLKQKGIFYIYDSNGAVSAGNGKIYSCNNDVGEKYGKGHTPVLKSGGYPFTSVILFAFVPRSNGKSNVPENCPFAHCAAYGSGKPVVQGKVNDDNKSTSKEESDEINSGDNVANLITTTQTTESDSIFTKLAKAGSQMMRSIYGEDVYDSIFGTTKNEEVNLGDGSTRSTNTSDTGNDISGSSDDKADDYNNTSLTGKKNSEKIWNFLKNNMKLTNEAAAGIMGNLEQESGLNPSLLEERYRGKLGKYSKTDESYTKAIDDGKISRSEFAGHKVDKGGYGLGQWTWYTRKQNLYDYLKKDKKVSIGDLAGQLEFLAKETSKMGITKRAINHYNVNAKEKEKLLKVMNRAKSPREAMHTFHAVFEDSGEQPGSYGYERRKKFANKWYKKFKDYKPPVTNSSNGTTSDKKYTNGTKAGRGRTEVIDNLNTSLNSIRTGNANRANALSSNTEYSTEKLLEIIIKILYSIATNTEAISDLADVMKNNKTTTNNISIDESDSKLSNAKISTAQAKAALKQLMSNDSGASGGFTSLLQGKSNDYILDMMSRLAQE